MSLSKTYQRKSGIARREIAGESFLIPICGTPVDMENIFVLNSLGDFIWQRLNGKHSLRQIAGQIAGEFDVSDAQSLSDTIEFVQQLENNHLVEILEDNL